MTNDLEIKEYYLTKNGCYNSGKRITPIGMQLHTIGTEQNTARSLADYWNQSGISVCVHYVVDAETENLIYNLLPENFRSGADGGFGNGNLITVELMESDYMKYTSGASFVITNQTKFLEDILRSYNTAVKFFAVKCLEHNWNPLAKLPNGLHVVSSHDEGRRLGLSTSHVDPTHLWGHIGKTMDIFRADVKKEMERRTAKPIKIWMGWLKRESGTKVYKCTNGDKGCAQGAYQFDYRYGLVPFMQFCYDYNKEHYSGFEKYIKYGAGNTQLIGNGSLAILWESYCDVYGKEFENLQDTFAYNNYYLEACRHVKSMHGIDMEKKHAVVKGTLFSMAIRSGAVTAAKKFEECVNTTSTKKILKAVYATYGNEDSKRWTKANQYGDALKALETGECKEFTILELPQKSELEKIKNWYRVGTAWSGGKCVNAVGAYELLSNAKSSADQMRDSKQTTYKVFDSTGKVVYTAEYKLYTVQCGAYSVEKSAHNFVNVLKASGIDAFVHYQNMKYVVQAGAFSNKSNADKLVKKIKSIGFDAIIV